MAVNINIGMQRRDANENFEEAVDQNNQQDLSSPSHDSSPHSGNSADHQPVPESAPVQPSDEPALIPAFARYGLGDTVIIGRPDYANINRNALSVLSNERDKNTPQSTPQSASESIPIAKPGSNMKPETSPQLTGPTITAGPINSGESADPPSLREPYNYSGLRTAPDQSPHYAIALAYGREHSYNDDEVMKLAVLMQNNGDQNMGREWLSLKPDVLRAAVNAVVRNADNSFDISGVFGGRAGYPDVAFISQRIPADAQTAAYGSSADNIAQGTYPKPEGWVLVEETVGGGSGDGGDSSTTLHYYQPGGELMIAHSGASPVLSALGYTQVQHGAESELSVGAAGGYRDLSRLTFHPDFGLITTPDNYIPFQTRDDVGGAIMGVLAVGFIAITGVPATEFVLTGATATQAAIYAGAINGAIGSFIFTGATGGEITFRGILQGALTGGIMGGLSTLQGYQNVQNLGLDRAGNVTNYALRAVSITGQATLQGALRELVGGHFRDGFTQGIAQGLAGEITRALNGDVAARLARQEITPEQARVLNQMTVLTGSAIRAASNPNNPAYAFAQDYLTQLFGTGAGSVGITTGINTVDAETQQQIIWAREAIDSGYLETAVGYLNDIVERRAAANPNVSRTDIADQLMRELGIKPDTLGFVVGANGRLTVDPSTIVTALPPAPTLEARNVQRQDDYARALQAMNTNLSDTDARALALRWMDSAYSPLDPDLPDNVRHAMERGLDPNMIIDLDTGSNFHPRALRPAAAQLYRDLIGAAEAQYGTDPARMSQAYRDIERTVNEYNGIIRSAEDILSGRAAQGERLNAILNDVAVRAGGLLQMIGGAGLVVAGAGAEFTGVGALLGTLGIILGGDQIYAGAQTVVNGTPARTMLGTALSNTMGIDASQAELIAGLASMSPALAESALANPALRTFLVERFGGMFGTNKPEIILGMERTFQRIVTLDADLSAGQLNNQVGRIAEDVVRQDLKNMGYRDVVAIQNTSGQGIDIIARAPNGDLVVFAFEVKGSSVGSFRPLTGDQADFTNFIRDRLERARAGSGTGNGNYSTEVQQAARTLLDQLGTGVPFHGIRVNVTLPKPGTPGRPQIVYLTWK